VLAMSLIHQRLYQTDNIGQIEFSDFLSQLFEQLKISYDMNVELETSSSSAALDIDTAIPLGLILNELLTNSFKHAFEDVDKALVKVRLNTLPDNAGYVLEYADNGAGLPDDLKIGECKSMGLRLVSRLSFQLFGEAHYINKKFEVTFKDLGQRML
jgi:two-component sensor histidine kinase